MIILFTSGCTININTDDDTPNTQKITSNQYQPTNAINYESIIESKIPQTTSEVKRYTTEMITISGVNQRRQINNQNPINLLISGTGNVIEVLDGTEVLRLTISGVNNQLSLPSTANPQTLNSGVNNEIYYR